MRVQYVESLDESTIQGSAVVVVSPSGVDEDSSGYLKRLRVVTSGRPTSSFRVGITNAVTSGGSTVMTFFEVPNGVDVPIPNVLRHVWTRNTSTGVSNIERSYISITPIGVSTADRTTVQAFGANLKTSP